MNRMYLSERSECVVHVSQEVLVAPSKVCFRDERTARRHPSTTEALTLDVATDAIRATASCRCP